MSGFATCQPFPYRDSTLQSNAANREATSAGSALQVSPMSFALPTCALFRRRMAETPYIGSQRGRLGIGELGPAHRRHRAAILLGLRHAVGYHFQYPGETAVAPQPLFLGQIRSQW